MPSNLANVRQRYELSPYMYSLAYLAYLKGEPVAPPLVYYYQNDMNVRRMGSEKLLGRDLLVATIADRNAPRQHDVYLPAGDWVNYHTNQWFHSTGQFFTGQPLYRDGTLAAAGSALDGYSQSDNSQHVNFTDANGHVHELYRHPAAQWVDNDLTAFAGIFQLPTYARAGAIIPKMYVDDKTMNILGKRTDGSTRNELIVRVYATKVPSSFKLYEDDGETIAYQSGAVRATGISQQLSADGKSETVTIAAASGSYDGAPASRNNVVELVTDGMQAKEVTLNDNELPQQTSSNSRPAED